MSNDRLAELITRPWNRRDFKLPAFVSRVPSMLTEEERRLVAWICQHWPRRDGTICDLGCYLGGSTAHIAYGASQSGRDIAIHAFDRFEIKEPAKHRWLYSRRPPYPRFAGIDMLPVFKDFLQPFGDHVHAHKGMLEDFTWSNGTIDILYVDICKSWKTMHHVMRQFYPSLEAGESLILHEDYLHPHHPWLVATTEALHPKLSLVSWAEDNIAVFQVTEPLDAETIEAVIAETADVARVFALLEQAKMRFPYARQREAIERHIAMLRRAPEAQTANQLHGPGGARMRRQDSSPGARRQARGAAR